MRVCIVLLFTWFCCHSVRAQILHTDSSSSFLEIKTVTLYSADVSPTGGGSVSINYIHRFRTSPEDPMRWVGWFGNELYPYIEENGEGMKYMKRYKNLSILRTVVMPIGIVAGGLMVADMWQNEVTWSDYQIALFAITASVSFPIVAIPHFNRKAMWKLNGLYNP